ncbi:MAG: hypothetical protein ACMVY4_14735 [Minwuia sp.]|uniref:hypothetical protein n=1 Tax=Minwuia sp. TaxID=2493630 RepID=UPI003A87DA1C
MAVMAIPVFVGLPVTPPIFQGRRSSAARRSATKFSQFGATAHQDYIPRRRPNRRSAAYAPSGETGGGCEAPRVWRTTVTRLALLSSALLLALSGYASAAEPANKADAPAKAAESTVSESADALKKPVETVDENKSAAEGEKSDIGIGANVGQAIEGSTNSE